MPLRSGLDDLHLVVGQEGAEAAPKMVIISKGSGLQDHADVAAVHDVHAEDAAQRRPSR
jgi:hypothetical protein